MIYSSTSSIAIHIGLHATDDGALVEGAKTAILDNRLPVDLFAHAEPTEGPLIDRIESWRLSQPTYLSTDHGVRGGRLVISAPSLLGSRQSVIASEALGQNFCKRLYHFLASIKPEKPVIFLALKNPATYLDRISHRGDLLREDHFRLQSLTWLPSISETIQACSDCRFVIWCNEDLPFIYPEVLSLLLGSPVPNRLFYDNPILRRILTDHGRNELMGNFLDNVQVDTRRWKRTLSDILKVHRRDRAINTTVSIGLDQRGVDYVSEAYDYDALQLAENENVTFIYP